MSRTTSGERVVMRAGDRAERALHSTEEEEHRQEEGGQPGRRRSVHSTRVRGSAYGSRASLPRRAGPYHENNTDSVWGNPRSRGAGSTRAGAGPRGAGRRAPHSSTTRNPIAPFWPCPKPWPASRNFPVDGTVKTWCTDTDTTRRAAAAGAAVAAVVSASAVAISATAARDLIDPSSTMELARRLSRRTAHRRIDRERLGDLVGGHRSGDCQ